MDSTERIVKTSTNIRTVINSYKDSLYLTLFSPPFLLFAPSRCGCRFRSNSRYREYRHDQRAFDYVPSCSRFVASVNDRYYPSTSPIESIEAERRVLFVGISRASTRLYISSSAVSIDEGKVKLSRPSRFISEIASCCQMPLKRLSSLAELSQGDNYYDLTGGVYTYLYHKKNRYYFGDRTAHLVALDAAQILATLYVTY